MVEGAGGNGMGTDGTFFGAIANDRAKTPLWYGFDAAWYRRRYARQLEEAGAVPDDASLTAGWQADEGSDGTSPNRYFDEEWYLKSYPDVRRSVQDKGIFRSGFQHYVDVGCQSCAGHWLFSAEHYLRENADYGLRAIRNAGYVNAYDHFLCVGDHDFRSPHVFFDAELFTLECLGRDIPFDPSRGAFSQYLSLENPAMGTVRTSWYFDPAWYLEKYPEVAELLETGQFIGPLHHYLACEEPTRYSPSPYFDEDYYLTQYPDVADAVAKGLFRNGYIHFVRAGIGEQRNPSAALDMKAFISTLDLPDVLNQAHVDNPFLLWVLQQEGRVVDEASVSSVTAANTLALRKVEAGLPSLFRQPLRFAPVSRASVQLSVVLFSRGNYLLDIATLTSLRAQGLSGLQVIVSSTGNALARQRLEQAVEGLRYFTCDELLSPVQQLQRIVPMLLGERVLLLEAGMQLLPMALSSAIQAMMKDRTGGTGRILTSTNKVLEAGSAVWRDGSVTSCGQGDVARSQSLSFQRSVDAVQGGLLFCHRKGMVEALAYLDGHVAEPFFTCFSMALRVQGETLSYWPAVQARMLHATVETYAGGHGAKEAMRRLFPVSLSEQAIVPSGHTVVAEERPGVMMVFSHLPRLEEGGPTRRIMQQIEAFRWLGWRVLVVGLDRGGEDRLVVPHDYPADVECRRDVRDFPAFLRERQAGLKILWLGGTEILSRIGPCLASGEFTLRKAAIVLDTVSQKGMGLRAVEEHMRRLVGVVDRPEILMRDARKELEHAWLCQGIVTGDARETDLLRRLGYDNVRHLPYAVLPRPFLPEDDFERRRGVLFPLSIHQAGDAGHDGFDWLCLSVMPDMRRHFGEDIPVGIGGYHHPVVDLGFYERLATLDGLVGKKTWPVMFRQCRVLAEPSRVPSRQATEILEAAGEGIPAVLSSPQLERLGWKDGREALDGGFNDPKRFAGQLIRLYEDRDLWMTLRDNAYAAVCQTHDDSHLHAAFGGFIESLFDGVDRVERPFVEEDVACRRRVFAPAPLKIALKAVSEPVTDTGESVGDEAEEEFMPLPTHLGVMLPQENQDQKDEARHD
ncbi:glycosyltransferase family protein [Bombella mellum]|nr:hypothetical protein [Bombella mellum]